MVKISVITAVFNGERTIRGCIESVQRQTHPARHMIVDGGSTDGTLDIISEYASVLGRVISEPDAGIYDAMNKGIAAADGDVIGILNADDFYADDTVLETVSARFGAREIDCCYGDLDYVSEADPMRVVRRWRSGPYRAEKFYNGWMPPHPTFFCRKRCYEQFGTFRLDMGSAADYELMLRFLLKHRLPAAYIPKVLVHMRNGGVSNATLKNRLLANAKDRKAWELNGIKPFPWTLHLKPLRKLPQFLPRHRRTNKWALTFGS